MTDEKKKGTDGIIQAAKDCLENYRTRNSDNIARAEEAIRFRALDQWPDAIKRDRESDPNGARPCPVLDKTNQYVRQIVNEERQNRAAIKISPVDDEGDPEVAKIYTGIIRHIEYASNAISAYTTAGEHAVDGGFGYFRLLTKYCDPKSFDQDILIKRIANRFSVALGPHSEIEGSDAREALIWEDLPTDEFERQHPKAKAVDFEAGGWSNEDTTRIAEYFCIKSESMTIHMVQGRVLTDDELKEAQAVMPGLVPDKTRTTTVDKVKWYKITSAEILEERDIPGIYIPVVKVTGNELVMPDGQVRLSGVIDSMMDPQRLHNYAHAGFIEHVALAPRAPWVAPTEAIAGHEQDYADANRKNIAVLTYNHKDEEGNPVPTPQRTPPPGISPGWQQMLQNTEHGIEASVGMYGPSVGAKSQEKSGIALEAQKQQGMVGNYHYPDNLSRAIQHCGRILLGWIPVYIDTPRVVRMLGEDEEATMAYLNPDQEKAVMPRLNSMNEEIGDSYNITVGKYDVTVSTGPSYTSKRQEAVTNQLSLIQAKPELMGLIGDIVFRNMDAPGSDKIADRLKAMLPPQIQQQEDSKDKKPVDPKTQAMMAQVEQATAQIQERAQMLQQAEAGLQQKAQEVGANQQEIEAERMKLESEKKVFMAEARTKMLELKMAEMELEMGKTQAMSEISAAMQPAQPEAPAMQQVMGTDAGGIVSMVKGVLRDDDIRHEQEMQQMQEMRVQIGQISEAVQMVAGLVHQSQQPPEIDVVYGEDGRIATVNGRNVNRRNARLN